MDINLIITKFLLSEINNEEKQVLKAWISQDDANKRYFAEVERLFNALEIINNHDNIDPEAAWNAIKNKLTLKTSTKKTQVLPVKTENRFVRYKRFAYAAIWLLTIGITFIGAYLIFTNKYKTNITYNEIAVPNGSKTFLSLKLFRTLSLIILFLWSKIIIYL